MENILKNKLLLQKAFQDLMENTYVNEDGAVCISDIEFSLYNFKGILLDFEKFLDSSKCTQ